MAVNYDNNVDITIYTKNACPQCVSTKELLKKLELPYNEINIEENPEVLDFLLAQGYRSAPVVITETDSWSGFNESKIRDLATNDAYDDTWDF